MSMGMNDDGQAVVSPPREDPDQHRHDVVNADDGPGPAPAIGTPPPRSQQRNDDRWDNRKTPPSRIRNGPQRLGRRGDPRMHRAVAARLADPGMSLLDALRAGGFDVKARGGGREDRGSGGDGVTLSQRKNQLSRRLRFARQHRLNHVGAGAGGGRVIAIAPRGVGVGDGRKPKPPLKRESMSGTEGEAGVGSGRSTDESFSSATPSSLSHPMRARDDSGSDVVASTDPPARTITGQKRPLCQLKEGEGRGELRPPPPTRDDHSRRSFGIPSSLGDAASGVAASFEGGRMGYFNLGNFGGVGPARTPTAVMNAQRMLHQVPVLGTGSKAGAGAGAEASLVGLALRNPYPAAEAGGGEVSKSATRTINQAQLTPEEGAYVNLLCQQRELQDRLLRAHIIKRYHEAIEMGLSPMLATPSASAFFGANAQLESMLQAHAQERPQSLAQLGSRGVNINLRAVNANQALALDAAMLRSDTAKVSTPIKGGGNTSVLPPSSSSSSGKLRQSTSLGETASGKQEVGSSSVASPGASKEARRRKLCL